MITMSGFEEAIKLSIREIANEEEKKCFARIEQRVANELNGIVMNFVQMVDYSFDEKQIIFKIRGDSK